MSGWYLREDVKRRPGRPFPSVCYFVKERPYMVYAAKRKQIPKSILHKHPDLTDLRGGLNFWGQRMAIDFLGKLYDAWVRAMSLDYRISVMKTHGFFPKLFLGDISQRGGGPIKISGGRTAHVTHQHGTQIDIYYITNTGENRTVTCYPGKSDKQSNWNTDLNARLLKVIFKAGGARVNYVITECEKLLVMDEFKDLVESKKIRSKPPHRDHFHVELI